MDRKILQYSLEKKLLNIYNTLDEASKYTNTSKSLISRACHHLANTGNGFLWRFEDDPIADFEKIIISNKRKVAQFDKKGNLIAIYNSIAEAAEKKFNKKRMAEEYIRIYSAGEVK